MIDRQIQLMDDFEAIDLPARNARATILAACRDRRSGEAFAVAPTPGAALHGALCSAARIHPTWSGSYGGMAAAIGLNKTHYFTLVDGGSLDAVARIAQELGYYVVARPDGSYLAGDRPVELGEAPED